MLFAVPRAGHRLQQEEKILWLRSISSRLTSGTTDHKFPSDRPGLPSGLGGTELRGPSPSCTNGSQNLAGLQCAAFQCLRTLITLTTSLDWGRGSMGPTSASGGSWTSWTNTG